LISDPENYRVLALIGRHQTQRRLMEALVQRGNDMSFRRNLERMAEIYGGIAIFSVDKGSTTHRAGVRAGDVLIVVNGRRVRRLSEYATARKLQAELLELVVVRDGREIKLWAGHRAAQPSTSAPIPENDNDNLTCPWRGAA
jgi:S1-C subfamily serine protease